MKTGTLATAALTVFGMVAVSEAYHGVQHAVREGVRQGIEESNRANEAKAERDRVSRMSDDEKLKLRRTRTDECNTRYAPSDRPACFAEMRSVGLEPLR